MTKVSKRTIFVKCCFVLNIDLHANIFPINMSRSHLLSLVIGKSKFFLFKIYFLNFVHDKSIGLIIYYLDHGLKTIHMTTHNTNNTHDYTQYKQYTFYTQYKQYIHFT